MVSNCSELSNLFKVNLFVSVCGKCTPVFEVHCYKLLKNSLDFLSELEKCEV